MYIGICDDNKNDLKAIRRIVSDALFYVEDIHFVEYSSGSKVISDIDKGVFQCDLLYLDIFMNQPDGMEVAKYIRDNEVDVDIIFVTNSKEHVYEGYLYKAYAYVLKETMKEKLPDATQRYMKEISTTEESLNVTSEGVVKRIPISKIYYIESDARKLIVHLKNENITFYGKLSELEAILGSKGFTRIHQSYMVRDSFVTKYTKSAVCIGDIQLPVSRKYASNI